MAKRLPYKANIQIDQAVMNNEIAINHLVGILDTQGITVSEIYRRIGLSINELHKLTNELKAIPVQLKEENKDAPAEQGKNAEEKQETI